MTVCAIVPSHNHHRAVPDIVARLHAAGLPIFIIDDGSDEPARSALASLQDPARGVFVHRLDCNQGKGSAVVEGFRLALAAEFSHAVQVDADGQHQLEALQELLCLSREFPDALVSGQAVYDSSAPMGRRIGRWVTHFWVWIETLSFHISDSMCGFRVYPLAALKTLLAEEQVGSRMEFDTEIMVRLFWRGTPVHMVPVKVIYPPRNTSNFRMLADNLRISAMHTRLVCTMLLRLPAIISRRLRAANGLLHWASLGERGAYWGLRLCTGAYRLLGPRFARWAVAPIVLYFLLTGGEQRRASRSFLTRALGRPPTRLELFRHFMEFAGRTIDTFGSWADGVPPHMFEVVDQPRVDETIADPRGGLFVVAHIGNFDVAHATLTPETRARFTLLVHTRNAVHYNRILGEVRPEAAMRIIQVTEIGPETAIELKDRVARGEWVVIAGDRTPVLSQGRVSHVPFMGAEAAFSDGPWILASLLGCPVYLLFCVRDGDRHLLTMESFAEQIVLPRREKATALHALAARYAERLEHYARQHPFQWFNFFEFWAR